MVIDITSAMSAILSALRMFVAWMMQTRISNGHGAGISIFGIACTSLAVWIIIEAFVPWSGGDDDDGGTF